MPSHLLESLAQIAGVSGLAIGVFYLLLRQIISKNIFPRLNQSRGFRLLLFLVAAALIVVLAAIGTTVMRRDQKVSPNVVAGELAAMRKENAEFAQRMEGKVDGLAREVHFIARSAQTNGVTKLDEVAQELKGYKSELRTLPPESPRFAWIQSRFVMLTARQSDLELQDQFMQQARMRLSQIEVELERQLASPANRYNVELRDKMIRILKVDRDLSDQLRSAADALVKVRQDLNEVRALLGDSRVNSTFKTLG